MKSMSKLIIGSTLLVSMGINTSIAADQKVDIFADCGIGGSLFKDNDTAAIISNIIWDVGTTAITSGISSPNTCAGAENVEAAQFIYESYENIEDEIAVGKGLHLNAMLNMLQCENQNTGKAVSALRQDLAVQVSDSNYSYMNKIEKSKVVFNSAVSSCNKSV